MPEPLHHLECSSFKEERWSPTFTTITNRALTLALERQMPDRASVNEGRGDRVNPKNSAASTIVMNGSQREIEIGRINGERQVREPPRRASILTKGQSEIPGTDCEPFHRWGHLQEQRQGYN
jgi:hypothetical protein